jgi:hypothetical protein
MLTNKQLELTPDQLKQYNAWATERAEAAAVGDAMLSHAISISFTFSPLGREVVAKCGRTELILED